MGSYIPSTPEQRVEMLKTLGMSSTAELYADVPKQALCGKLKLPRGKSELETAAHMQDLASRNTVFCEIFRGAGAYNHYIPSIVRSVVSKEEFLTAYTPYQAEISQGILQSIFEYQTMICELTGMDVSNASVYDGACAAAEAAAMCRERTRTKVLVAQTLNPRWLEVVSAYCFGHDAQAVVVPQKDGVTDTGALKELLGDDVSCFIAAGPNFNGLLEPMAQLADTVHDAGAKLVACVNPISLGILAAPAEYGADIAVGEGQPLGMPLSFGGPYLGFMACKKEMMRRLPGRIVGETTDRNGERAFVLTLQAREQHIRREKASSNICSNQALCAMTAAVYLSAVGADGLRRAAQLCHSNAGYLMNSLCAVNGFKRVHIGEFFNEFVLTCPCEPRQLLSALEKKGILGGLSVEGGILWCATELNRRDSVDSLVAAVKEALS